MRKENELLFLGLAFALPLPCVGLQTLTQSAPLRFLLYGLQAASPSLAACIVMGKNGQLRDFFARRFSRNAVAFLLPLLTAFFTMLLAKGIACAALGEPFALGSVSVSRAVVLAWAFVAEELGWRGYLQPALQGRIRRPGLAPLPVGILWGLWHYHYFLFGGMRAPLAAFFAGCIAESFLYDRLLRAAKGSLFAAMTYHFAWNLFLHVFAIEGGSYLLVSVLEVFLCILLGRFCDERRSA